MESWLAYPLSWRLAIVFVIGVLLGHIVNWVIARLLFKQLEYHPWTRRKSHHESSKSLLRFVPVLGWIVRRNESKQFGQEFWVRPLCIELLTGFLFIVIYSWETVALGLVPSELQEVLRDGELAAVGTNAYKQWLDAQLAFHQTFVAHAILTLFLLAATFIDWDEKTIPDEITVIGTLLALVGIRFFPLAVMPYMNVIYVPNGVDIVSLEHVQFASPNDMPSLAAPSPNFSSLAIVCYCYGIWAFGLLPRIWYSRHGLMRAWQFFWAKIAYHGNLKMFGLILIGGWMGIAFAWMRGGFAWQSLFSAIMGMFVGGLLVWLVRIVGKLGLGIEAMGFGDVTLMAMIGAVLGWQATVIIFFLAPLPALVFGIAQWIRQSENVLPYGPFLCIATWGTLLMWAPCWEYLRPFLEVMPWLVPSVLAVCVILIGVLLRLIRMIRGSYN
jgi:leader peptidase (prepilin peptidase) / N-methyltransferase